MVLRLFLPAQLRPVGDSRGVLSRVVCALSQTVNLSPRKKSVARPCKGRFIRHSRQRGSPALAGGLCPSATRPSARGESVRVAVGRGGSSGSRYWIFPHQP